MCATRETRRRSIILLHYRSPENNKKKLGDPVRRIDKEYMVG
jgi:hypothetical protein